MNCKLSPISYSKSFLHTDILHLINPICYNNVMKTLAILSDLHLDVNQFDAKYEAILIQTLLAESITDVHIAGDISNNFEEISKPFLKDYFKELKFLQDYKI